MSALVQLGDELWATPDDVLLVYRSEPMSIGGVKTPGYTYVKFRGGVTRSSNWPLARVARILNLPDRAWIHGIWER